jgi:hypothetical protein
VLSYPDIEFEKGSHSRHDRAIILRTIKSFWRVFWDLPYARKELGGIKKIKVDGLKKDEEDRIDGRFMDNLSSSRTFEFRVGACVNGKTLAKTVVHQLLHGLFFLDYRMQRRFPGTYNLEEAIVELSTEEVFRRFKR